ncbi:MAG: cell wall-binding repeat-containing protein [Coriobacteriia bacterium]|nr:cell wall-binding repeat-containing protein [Coriobacteriia bacterium]
MDQTFKKAAGMRRRARLSVLLCVALVLGALPGAAWAGGTPPAVAASGATSLSAVGFVGWKAVSAGEEYSLGIKDDGSLWAWGSNSYGRLSNDTSSPDTYKTIPVLIDSPLPDGTAPISACDFLVSYIGTATVTITATDPAVAGEEVSGVKQVTYMLDDDAPVVTSGDEAVVVVSGGGNHALGFFATDNAGNTEETKTVTFEVMPVDGSDPEDMPITATIRSRHHTLSSPLNPDCSASEITSPSPCSACHASSITGCTYEGCHRVAEARELDPEELGDDPPANHSYIRPDTYGCEDCHKVMGGGTIRRIAGDDRYQTAIKVSEANFESAGSVIIATGMNYADALSASALAGTLRAPLLLTRVEVLSPGVLAEVERLGAKDVYIMGSTAAVSAAVADALASEGLSVERIGGADRYETSALIAGKVASLTGPGFARKAFLARGDNFADGLSASPVAYANRYPVILTRPTSLPAPASGTITSLGITDVTITGSEAAVSAGVEAAVRALPTGPTVRRLAGTDRYGTAQKIAEHALTESLATKGFIGVATGLNFPDVLAGGVATGERGGIIVLTEPAALSPVWDTYLPGAYAGTKPDIQLFGGSNVLSDNVMSTLKEMLID